jgi:hypothetical protein
VWGGGGRYYVLRAVTLDARVGREQRDAFIGLD